MKGARPLTNDEILLVAEPFDGTFAIRNRSLFLLQRGLIDPEAILERRFVGNVTTGEKKIIPITRARMSDTALC